MFLTKFTAKETGSQRELSCCVINFTNRFTISAGINFSRFPESEPKPMAWIDQFVEGISPSAHESALFTSCQALGTKLIIA